ncbi:response regulator transcription factor [Aquirufa ecclesiirivi]|uniref:Response regulator n=1 Tax=Aquirufa ecclesiirivi TaxID=2715124 RepID=A0ABT4JC90_9BACT|nr:response regulator transcription factor [Aquirufa ecclesiirivi]MCZ2473916.1 response regulator [Aquirufa ecclesiirivi]MDF0694120.1 response regulator transcription factor [Aquirufa ecclesiirivi]NHC50123.1 response regulator [Aquirufa ecclesiirivi]
MKVLLAEDNEILRTSLSFFLKKQGFEVSPFSNGKDALESIKVHKYDIILSDINMPGFSGLEITEYVRNTMQLETPIIIFTSSTVEQTELDSFRIGANEFIAKPVSPAILLIRMNKLLNQ